MGFIYIQHVMYFEGKQVQVVARIILDMDLRLNGSKFFA